MSSTQIKNSDEILVDGQSIGTIKGLRFNQVKSEKSDMELSSHQDIILSKLNHICDRLVRAPNDEIILSIDGSLRWRGEIIATLSKGENKYLPKIILLADDIIDKENILKVTERLELWLRHHINSQLELILALQNPNEIEGQALELCNILYENFGLVARQKVANIVKGLDQDIRAKLRRFGIKFGAYHIYLPLTLKPAPRELMLILWTLDNGNPKQEGLADLPHIILSGRTSFEINQNANKQLYEIAGFKVAGNRAVRIDILERLADIIRPLIALDSDSFEGELPQGAAPKNGFRVTVEMTSLLGCAGADFSSILSSLGYRVTRTKIEKPDSDTNEDNKNLNTSARELSASLDKNQMLKDTDLKDDKKISGEDDKPEKDKEEEKEQFDEVWYFNYQRNPTPNKSKAKLKDNKSKNNYKKYQKATDKKPHKQAQKPIDKDSPFAMLATLQLKK